MDTTAGGFLPWLQRKSIEVLGFSLPIPLGHGVFQYSYGLIPHRREINVVVGAPMPQCPKLEGEPDPDVVKEWHDRYKAALIALHNKYKKQFGRNESMYIVH